MNEIKEALINLKNTWLESREEKARKWVGDNEFIEWKQQQYPEMEVIEAVDIYEETNRKARLGEGYIAALCLPIKYQRMEFDNYSGITESQDTALKQCQAFDSNSYPNSLFLWGNTWVGKTHLAVSVLKAQIRKHGIRGKCCKTLELLNDFRADFSTKGNGGLIEYEEVKKAPIIVLDDFGIGKTSDWVTEKVYSLIDHRNINEHPTIFTSTKSIEQLKYEPGIISNLLEMTKGNVIRIIGEDSRLDFTNHSTSFVKSRQR